MAASAQDSLQIGDGLRFRTTTLKSSGVIPDRITVILADAVAGAFTLTLPPVASVPGQILIVKKIDSTSNIVTVAASAGETVDGVASQALTIQYQGIFLISDGTKWLLTDPIATGDFDGILITQPADVSGTPTPALKLNAGAHSFVLNAEQTDVNLNLARTVTFVGGGAAIPTQRAELLQAPTYSSSLSQTITTAATLAITGAPAAAGGMTITNPLALWVQSGNVQFGAVGSGLFWDNAQSIFKLGSVASTNTPTVSLNNAQGEQVRLTQRLTGDGLVNALTTGGDLRILDPANGRQCDLTFYTYGVSMAFNCNLGASGSIFEFHGFQQSSLFSPGVSQPTAILSIVTATDAVHEIHVRPVSDNDGIVLCYPLNSIPYISTDNVAASSTSMDFGAYRTRMLRLTNSSGTSDFYTRLTGSATNQNVRLTFEDNQFNAQKGQILYAGGNSAGSRYFGLTNQGADYILLASDVTIFKDGAQATEYARFISGGSWGLGTATPRKHLDILDTNNTHLRLTYTDNSVYTDFFTNSSGQLTVKPSGSLITFQAPSLITYLTGSATNQTIGHQLVDNNATLKGQLTYQGANGGGSKYFGLLNHAADYLVLGSDTISLRNLSGFTEAFGATYPASVINISFFGATKVPKQTRGATFTNNITSGGTTDSPANWTDLTTYANDAAAIRNFCYQMARAMNQHDVALRAYGLLT